MGKEFEPYYNEGKTNEFATWEFESIKHATPRVSKEEEFANECEQLRQEAIAAGRAQGLKQAEEEIQAKKEELAQWVELLQKPALLLDDKLTQELIQTLIWLSQYCIGVELSVNPEKLRDLFDEIKKELPSLQGDKVFAMHPDDVNWVKTEMSEQEIPGLHDILVTDPTLSRGDFYLKSEHSELDGRLQTRFITLFAKYLEKDDLITPMKSQD